MLYRLRSTFLKTSSCCHISVSNNGWPNLYFLPLLGSHIGLYFFSYWSPWKWFVVLSVHNCRSYCDDLCFWQTEMWKLLFLNRSLTQSGQPGLKLKMLIFFLCWFNHLLSPASECHALCHPKCSPYLPATCGVPTEYALHLSEALCREKGSASGLKDIGGHMRLEGWLKQPRWAVCHEHEHHQKRSKH